MHKINHADIKEWASNYDGPLFDGILCDPPYELGFMGKSWDSSGIAFDTEMWADIFKLLKPGAHLLAFSGSRTYHRMAVAIEDAGFEIRDMIEWVYGSGFPKSLNIGKAVDKINAKDFETCLKFTEYLISKKGDYSNADIDKHLGLDNGAFHFFAKSKSNNAIPRKEHYIKLKDLLSLEDEWDWYIEEAEREVIGKKEKQMQGWSMEGQTKFVDRDITLPATEQAKIWEGYGTALKPAHEPCVLARKPLDGTVANNVLKHGTGGLAIDNCRVGTEKLGGQIVKSSMGRRTSDGGEHQDFIATEATGRFPANLILSDDPEVEAVFPSNKSTKTKAHDNRTNTGSSMFIDGVHNPENSYSDGGSASRFFYTAKASKSERNAGLEGFELREPPASARSKPAEGRQNALGEPRQNHHPTVKPLSLTKYLATLIKPPSGGRLLVPFSGSGSEMIGALQAGWEYVEGVELTEEYIPIAEARIKHWMSVPVQESLLTTREDK